MGLYDKKTGGAEMKKLSLLFVAEISLVFTVSCVSTEIEVTETYYETEYRTEEYSAVEKGEVELRPETYWYCNNLVMQGQNPAPPPPLKRRSAVGFQDWDTIDFSGVLYVDYELPQHSTSKVVIRTQEESNTAIELEIPIQLAIGCEKYEMVSAYDVTEIGHVTKPPFDKPLEQVTLWTIFPRGYLPPKSWTTESPLVPLGDELWFRNWLDKFNTQLKASHLDTQLSCTYYYVSSLGSELSWEEHEALMKSTNRTKQAYEFQTTGVKSLAIIIAGRGQYELPPSSESLVLHSEFLPDNPWPIESMKLVWADEVTKKHEVPYEVEKQRTVIQTKKVPFWEAIFH